MSEVLVNNDVAAVLTGIIGETAYLLARDLDATPDEMCSACHEGKARSVLAMAAEVAGFNHLVAALARGEQKGFPSPDESAAFVATITSRSAAKAALDASVADLMTTIAGISPDDWMTKIMAPWGMEITKAHVCSWAALHIMYHDGQVNFIQILNGDSAVHWMDQPVEH